MIVEKGSTHKVEGTLDGEKVAMDIDDSAKAHIMSLLTDLYGNPRRAVLREYATNALDAHIEAGSSAPIEVALPSRMAPFLTIRDLGVGLDAEGIREVYSKYGASTKRSTNDQVGMLGLGCKSALTYCDQFTVVGVKNAVRTQVAIGRDEDGTGVMEIVDETPTDDVNGVTVVVPVKTEDVTFFREDAVQFFSFWDEGTVLVNGEAPARIGGLAITDKILVVHDDDASYYNKPKNYLVMGNVAYPFEHDFDLPSESAVVAWVPIGSLSIPPAREGVMDTPLTRATIAQVEADFARGRAKAVQKAIDTATTGFEAVDKRVEAEATLGKVRDATYKWRGHVMPASLEMPKQHDPNNVNQGDRLLEHDLGGPLNRAGRASQVVLNTVRRNVLVTGYSRADWTPGQAKKVRHWISENQGIKDDDAQGSYRDRTRYVILTREAKPDATRWLQPHRVIDWATIDAIKLSRDAATGRTGRPTGAYDVVTCDPDERYFYPEAKTALDLDAHLAAGGKLYHFEGSKHGAAEYARSLDKGDLLVCLPSTRVAKYVRYFDATRSVAVRDHLASAAKRWAHRVLTTDVKEALAIHDGDDDAILRTLDAAKVDCPVLKRAIGLAKRDLNDVKKARRIHTRWDWEATQGLPAESPLREYPLVPRNSYRTTDAADEHTYLYLNAVHAAQV